MPLWTRDGTMKQFAVYLMSNASMTLYIGVPNDLERRVQEHKSGETEGFTKKYRCTRLVYYELFLDVTSGIAREKQLKGWKRKRKIDLVKTKNPEWHDLTDDLFGQA